MNEETDRYTILVPSNDAYSDLWKPFLHYLDENWDWRTSTILLGSNSVTGHFLGAEVCTVGASEHWGEHVLNLLDMVKTDTVLLMMPDYFLFRPVDHRLFDYYLELFEHKQLKCLTLTPRSIHSRTPTIYNGCKTVDLLGAYSVTLEVAFWKVSALRDALRPEDSPWSLERSARITAEDPRKWCFATDSVFHYVSTGALIRSSWTRRSQRNMIRDGLQDCLGGRGVLTRRESLLYGARTLVFRGIALVWPMLIRRYNRKHSAPRVTSTS